LLLHPVIAESGFAGLGVAVSGSTVADGFPAPARVCADLLQRFAQVSDGRRDQGRIHPVAVVLALCAAAVVAGMASFTAIAGWATDVPAEVLVKLYGRRSDPPSKATIWRVVTGADAATVDAVIGAWLLAQAAARDTAAREVVAGEVVAPGTDRETPELLAIMVDGKAVRGATVQPRLFAALDALPWAQTPIAASVIDRAHGRITTRTIQVMPAPEDLPFPHLNQVWLIERYVTALDGTPSSAVAALGVTNLTADTTAPQRLAALVRNHWGIESLHWLRDTVYREDASTVRTSSGPRVMAGLRNLAVGAHHLAGRRDITEASREAGRVMHRPFKILKLA
jgi:DDE family transposase